MKKINFANILFFIFFPLNLFGQFSDTLEIEELVVTSTRTKSYLKNTPELIRVITKDEIRSLHVQSIGGVLEHFTGINIETGTGSGLPKRSIVSINGFPASYNLVLVDGVRLLSDHILTGQNIELIPLENIERIEIIKSASSAQYGSDAMGGIINIITRKFTKKPSVELFSSYGSYNSFRTGLRFGSPIGDRSGISSFTSWESSDGYPILAPAHRIGGMGFGKLTSMQSFEYHFSETTEIRAYLHFVQNDYEFRQDDVQSRLLIPGFDFDSKLTENLRLHVKTSYTGWNSEVNDERNQLLHPEAYLAYTGIENNTLIAGTDVRFMNFRRSKVLEKNQTGTGFFIQDQYKWERTILNASVRLDKVDQIKTVFSPKLSLKFGPLKWIDLRASIGRGFHAPTVQELYEEGYGHDGRAYRFGNPALLPEYTTSTAVSAEIHPAKNLAVVISGYYSKINNMISPVYTGIWEENPDTTTIIDKWERTNIYAANILGGDIFLDWKIRNYMQFIAGYTHNHNKNETTGKSLPYYPGKSFFFKITFKTALSEKSLLDGFVSFRTVYDRSAWNWKPAPDAEIDNMDGLTTSLEDYQLLNAGINFNWSDRFIIYFSVDNILGQDIENLDDVLTKIKGEQVLRSGISLNF